MPGFRVGNLGDGPTNKPKAYYKYTWDISSIFEDQLNGVAQNQGFRAATGIIYAKEASLPSWEFDREEVVGSSLRYKFAKSVSFNDIRIAWYDTAGFETVVRMWRRRVWTPERGLSNPSDYKKETRIDSYTYDLVKKNQWLLMNSWPQRISAGDLTYTDSDVKVVEVTVAYDWAEDSK